MEPRQAADLYLKRRQAKGHLVEYIRYMRPAILPDFQHEFRLKGGEQFVYDMTTVMWIFAARKLDAWGCVHSIGDLIPGEKLTARERRLVARH